MDFLDFLDPIGNLLGGFADWRQADMNREFTAGQSRLSREFNAEQAALDRKFQAEQAVKANKFSREMFGQNAALQREFAQMGIRWKMQDAIAAGINPNYAIGAAGVSGMPIPVQAAGVSGSAAHSSPGSAPYTPEVGSHISAAISALNPELRLQRLMNLKESAARAEKDEAIAAAYNSEAARMGQSYNTSIPPGVGEGVQLVVPNRRVSADPDDPSVTAGKNKPMFSDYEGPFGSTVRMIDPELSESLEGLTGDVIKTVLMALGNLDLGQQTVLDVINRKIKQLIANPPPPPKLPPQRRFYPKGMR